MRAVSRQVDAEFLLDGENAGQGYDRITFSPVEGNEVRFALAIGLTAQEWDALHSLDLLLVYREACAYGGVELPQNGWARVPYRDGSVDAAYEARRFADCPLSLLG